MTSLQTLELTRFKCLASQRIALSAATVLTGFNGMGKSSVIQSLLLLRQSARAGVLHAPLPDGGPAGLLLNGEFARLGTGTEVHYEGAAEDTLAIAIEAEAAPPAAWCFRAGEKGSPYQDLLPWIDGPASLPQLSLFGSHCYYLGAERIGPRTVHALSASQIERHDLGADGTMAVAFLDAHDEREVLPPVRHAVSTSAPPSAGTGLDGRDLARGAARDPGARRARLGPPLVLVLDGWCHVARLPADQRRIRPQLHASGRRRAARGSGGQPGVDRESGGSPPPARPDGDGRSHRAGGSRRRPGDRRDPQRSCDQWVPGGGERGARGTRARRLSLFPANHGDARR